MGQGSKIEWTDATWNPVTGCKEISPGCANCYAAKLAATRLAEQSRYKGLAVVGGNGHPHWTGEVRLHPDRLGEPLRWKTPRKIFVCDMSDLFHKDVPDWFLARVWLNMATASRHTFQVLTKRPARMLDFCRRWADLSGEPDEPQLVRGPEETRKAHPSGRGQLYAAFLESMGTPPPGAAFPTFDWMEGPRWWAPYPDNVWLGVSVEDQQRADERVPLLLQVPARVRFLSCEPLLGPVDVSRYLVPWSNGARVDWVIVGGESGPGARACDLAWVRSLVRQCKETGTSCFVKQLGTWSFDGGSHAASPDGLHLPTEPRRLRDGKGGDVAEWPEGLRIREFPND